jgi:hypothetical protein
MLNHKKLLLAIGLITALLIIVFLFQLERWPKYTIKPEYRPIVEQSIKKYKETGQDYKQNICNYDHIGSYLNFANKYSDTERFQPDADGIPMVKYGDKFYYNPVTTAQHALSLYNACLNGKDVLHDFLTAADRLLEMQDESGAFPYHFPFKYAVTDDILEPGWVSGMAQGQALSVFARAYHLTNEERYIKAGNKSLKFLLTPVDQGGVMDTLEDLHPSLHEYIIFEEYIADPATYTLNGYMFALLGVYDWSQISSGEEQKLSADYFNRGVKTLEKILPYYDIGGFSAYDLSHITYNKKPHIGINYHAIHIYLLHALHTITNNETLHEYEQLWASYVE